MNVYVFDPAGPSHSAARVPQLRVAAPHVSRIRQHSTGPSSRVLQAAIMGLSRDNPLRRTYAIRRWQGQVGGEAIQSAAHR
jgi:hypothetical protein